MLIKTVTSVVTTNGIGQTVESVPLRYAADTETDVLGRPIDVVDVEESQLGIPVRYVMGKVTQNSAGQWEDVIPVKRGIKGQRIIFDTDMDSDCDDIAALAMLLQMERLGECTIIAAVVASNNDYAAPCTKTLLRAGGRGGVTVGAYQGNAIGGGNSSLYTQQVVAKYGSPSTETRAAYDTAVNVLRRALAASPDNSVKIIEAATCTNIAALLASSACALRNFWTLFSVNPGHQFH